MPRMRAHRPVLSLLRVLSALVLVLSLSGVSHAMEEVAESVVHMTDTGHGMHAEPQPDCPEECCEHFCFGAIHHCGCCPTTVAVAAQSVPPLSHVARRRQAFIIDDDVTRDGISSRVDRPPRA